jgi:hypothetical protein
VQKIKLAAIGKCVSYYKICAKIANIHNKKAVPDQETALVYIKALIIK